LSTPLPQSSSPRHSLIILPKAARSDFPISAIPATPITALLLLILKILSRGFEPMPELVSLVTNLNARSLFVISTAKSLAIAVVQVVGNLEIGLKWYRLQDIHTL